MASSLSRRLYNSILSKSKASNLSMPFCTNLSSPETSDSDDSTLHSSHSVPLSSPSTSTSPSPSPSPSESTQQRTLFDRPLENGLDVGIYKERRVEILLACDTTSLEKPREEERETSHNITQFLKTLPICNAIIVGQVGQSPLQKRLKGGRTVTLLSVGTGGIRNNRRPLDNEEPRDYANRCAVQWHRVSIYPERLGDIAMKHAIPGSILYLEGNLETKVFSDPISGLVRRIREIAVRANGRLVFLGKGDDAQQPSQTELKGVGYY